MLAVIHAYRAGLFHTRFLIRNIFAGIVVGVLAAPLAIAFAIASGAQPEQGLYTAIITSFSVAMFGGTHVQIAGPTSALVMILSTVTQTYGVAAMQMVTLMAGVILILMGMLKLGDIVRGIPTTVVHGFSFGIGISIFVNQFKEFFGLTVALNSSTPFLQKIYLFGLDFLFFST